MELSEIILTLVGILAAITGGAGQRNTAGGSGTQGYNGGGGQNSYNAGCGGGGGG
jgi:hypothetical protein